MNGDSAEHNRALDGAIVPTFIKYLLPSLIGLLAMTSGSLVDGIFIGNYVGVTALAAVNLIIPILTLSFGICIMVGVGASVRGGKYLGERNIPAASAIFSKTLIFMVFYGFLAIAMALLFERQLFSGLGASADLFPVMSEYYRIAAPFLLPQFITIALYFFVRLDESPNLAAAALGVGAALNIALDYLFIAVYDWGLVGAAIATGLSQVASMLVLLSYFLKPKRVLRFAWRQKDWMEVLRAAYNGLSEFINEVSGGIIALIFNWMLIQRAGVEGVAAITVVNYMLMVGFMAFFAISDTIQVMVSQNFGARNPERIRAFLKTALAAVGLVSALCITVLLSASEPLIGLFIDHRVGQGSDTLQLAMTFVVYVWPLFLFAGVNMLICGYLTAIHRPFQSGLISISRSLILPAGLLTLSYGVLSDYRFIAALPVAEGLTFVLASFIYLRDTPLRAVRREEQEVAHSKAPME